MVILTDLNPSLKETQSLLISSSSNESNLKILLESCGEYMLDRKQCSEIIQEVVSVVKGWKTLAVKLQIPAMEMHRFSARFDKHTSHWA